MKHCCHAHGCTTQIPPKIFMCLTHWNMVPKRIQAAIWREYRPGQEKDKEASARYMAVQKLAVGTVAFKPNDEQAARDAAPYIWAAGNWRQFAIDRGEGDPLYGLAP